MLFRSRGTMEEADHLFGVTMQEKGVSRIIELSLDEAAKTCLLYTSTPVLPPKEKEQRKKEIERCLYEVFSKYGDRFP